MFLSFFAEKINVLIIGGGKAALIKAKSYQANGCNLTLIAPDILPELKELSKEGLEIIKKKYYSEIISDFHLVIIATDNQELNQQIKRDCEKLRKLYLAAYKASEGLFTTPVIRETKEAKLALRTRKGNPGTSVFIAEKLKQQLTNYDQFIAFSSNLRKQILAHPQKEEIFKTINSEDFLIRFNQQEGETSLKEKFPGLIFEQDTGC